MPFDPMRMESALSAAGSTGSIPSPPGRRAPILGRIADTREFLRGWRAFFERRREAFGSTVFRTQIAWPAVTLIDVEGFQVLFDTGAVQKRYGFGPAIPRRDLVGGIVPTVFANDEAHARQKRFLLEIVADATPRLEKTVLDWVDRAIARWDEAEKPFDWGKEGDDLLASVLFEWILGTAADSADVRGWIDHVLSPLPWDLPTPRAPRPAREARDRLLIAIRGAPRFAEVAAGGRDAAGWSSDETARQLLFLLCFNAWGGLHGVWRSLLAEISLDPLLADRIHAEIAAAVPAGRPGLAHLGRMPLLRGCVLETLRLHGPVPFAYGQARRDLIVRSGTGAYRVRRGEMLQGSFWMAGRDPSAFEDPDRFDPARHARPEVARRVLWANGPGDLAPGPEDKICAGRDVVPAILALLLARLLQDRRWTLQDAPRWSDRRMLVGNRPVEPLLVTSFGPRGS